MEETEFMKATGIVRRIDDLGRIVVPKEIRRTLRIREGDPLEIFTSREGEIMLKKYSPIGEMGEIAGNCAEALAQAAEALVCITDRDYIVAASGSGRKELEGEHISPQVEALMEKRGTYVVNHVHEELPLVTKEWTGDHKGAALSAIICNGDCQGSVIVVTQSDNPQKLETIRILAQSAAGFIGKHMEQ